MKTISEIYKLLSEEVSDLEARMILEKRAGIDWAALIANPNQGIATDLILTDLAARKSGKPLSRIYGTREFWGLEFEINDHTLDPRPDSETVIEAALKHFKAKPPQRILDLGTGSGCLLLSLLKEWSETTGIGIDLSFAATKTAQNNAKFLGIGTRAAFITGSWAESINAKFDLIIANPPYIDSKVIPNLDIEVRNHDPILALDGGEDGMQAYNQIFSQLKTILNPDGIALFEIGFDQAEKITRLSENHGLNRGQVYSDLAGNPRVVDMFLK